MKIGYLTERLIQGFGMDLLVHYQANELVRLGHDVTVFTIMFDDFYPDRLYKVEQLPSPFGIKVIRFPAFLLKYTFFRKLDTWLNAALDPIYAELRLIKANRKRLNAAGMDAWINMMFPTFALTPFLKKPVFIIEGGTVSSQGFNLKKKLQFWYQKYCNRWLYYPFAKRIVPFSKYLIRQIPLPLRYKVAVNYLGANHYTDTYKPSAELNAFKERYQISDTDIVILYVGRLNPVNQPYKGVDDLIEIYNTAKKSEPRLKLIMAGFGDESDVEYLQHHRITGINNAEDIELLYLLDICQFYVSATKWEGFNLPMMEAQSMGKPPVVYNIGPHKELLNDGKDSFVVDTQAEFIEKIVYLAKHKDVCLSMGQAAKHNAAKFTWKHSAKNMFQIISKSLQ